MKKGFFWLFYLLFLTFFDIVLAVIRLNNSIYEFFINLNIKNEWILENLFSLEETVRGGRLYGSCILRSARRVPGACQL